jgi:hypothetical protein
VGAHRGEFWVVLCWNSGLFLACFLWKCVSVLVGIGWTVDVLVLFMLCFSTCVSMVVGVLPMAHICHQYAPDLLAKSSVYRSINTTPDFLGAQPIILSSTANHT